MSINSSSGWKKTQSDALPIDLGSNKKCVLCDTFVPSNRHTYCAPCSDKARKVRTRTKDDKKRVGCLRCGGDKGYGRGSRFCGPCREALLPMWKQAELERSRRRSGAAAVGPTTRKSATAPPGTKWCPRCQQYRAFERFTPRRSSKDGMAGYCMTCASEGALEYRLKRVFNLTIADYDTMLEAQNGRCAICQRKPQARRLAVDHNHKTGAVRGLLCTRCNHKLLGASNESSEILRRAADYLDSYDGDLLREATK